MQQHYSLKLPEWHRYRGIIEKGRFIDSAIHFANFGRGSLQRRQRRPGHPGVTRENSTLV